ncbi:hypothetical protein BU15DRAFT_77658 [Melanogaster broomeanus]|nr:hypothetical protein BU15DRAFT_77658 [Melanogaster broomeanus]
MVRFRQFESWWDFRLVFTSTTLRTAPRKPPYIIPAGTQANVQQLPGVRAKFLICISMNISYSEASPLISKKEEQKAGREWLLPAMLVIFAILGIVFGTNGITNGASTKHWHTFTGNKKKDKEREAREEEERQRLNLVWVNEESHSCITYGTREYTAWLANVPSGYKRGVEACKKTPLVIHGVSYLPHTCKDNRLGGIVGSWRINQGQPDCTTFWVDYKDKGCTAAGSGKRRIEHRLENLPTGGNWREFAAATPVRFNGLQFSGAEEAFQSLWGVYGLWEIDDYEC